MTTAAERAAALAENEACEKICDAMDLASYPDRKPFGHDFAIAIRARRAQIEAEYKDGITANQERRLSPELSELKPDESSNRSSSESVGGEKQSRREAGRCDEVRSGGAESSARLGDAGQHQVKDGADPQVSKNIQQLGIEDLVKENSARARSPETKETSESAPAASAPPRSVPHYIREKSLDKRIAKGDDFAGDAWVRYTAVGHTPDDWAWKEPDLPICPPGSVCVDRGKAEFLQAHMTGMLVGSCNCGTKNFDYDMHSKYCPYRRASEALVVIDAMLVAPQQVKP